MKRKRISEHRYFRWHFHGKKWNKKWNKDRNPKPLVNLSTLMIHNVLINLQMNQRDYCEIRCKLRVYVHTNILWVSSGQNSTSHCGYQRLAIIITTKHRITITSGTKCDNRSHTKEIGGMNEMGNYNKIATKRTVLNRKVITIQSVLITKQGEF